MDRRRRLEVFFILYLAALAAFVVVSRERNVQDERRDREAIELLTRLVPKLPLAFEGDTIIFRVAADTSGHIHHGMPATFDILVSDIDPVDSITVTIHALTRDSTLVPLRPLRIGGRLGTGDIARRIVRFPVSCAFDRTGTYIVHLEGRSRRIHVISDSLWTYRGSLLPVNAVTRRLVAEAEHAVINVPVRVVDTTRRARQPLVPMTLRASATVVESAVGMREFVEITANNASADPWARIVHGGGRLEPATKDFRDMTWRWEGTITEWPDSVVIEAEVNRGGGALDIARTAFRVQPRTPMLDAPLPEHAYAGEDLICDLRVQGLRDAALYSWKLYEEANEGQDIVKASGEGSRVLYHIPNNFVGKRLRLDVRYNCSEYRYIDPFTHTGGPSIFRFTVLQPPVRIDIAPPAVLRPGQIVEFRAAAWHSEAYRTEQPVKKVSEVKVSLVMADGRIMQASTTMIRHGIFLFSFDNALAVAPGGESAVLHISARESSVQFPVRVERP